MANQADEQAQRSEAIVALAAHQLSAAWQQVDWESPDAPNAVTALYGGVVTKFGQATAAVAATVYDDLREAQGVKGTFHAEPADPMPGAQIDKAVKSAFLGVDKPIDVPFAENQVKVLSGNLANLRDQGMADDSGPVRYHEEQIAKFEGQIAAAAAGTTSTLPVEQRVPARLEGSLQRRVMDPARRTVSKNIAQDPSKPRYVRVPRGATTCAFCILLASRDIGPQFRGYGAASVRTDPDTGTQYLVDRNGDRYHNHCDCEAIPLFGQAPSEVSPHFDDYRDLYERGAEAAGTRSDLKAVLAAMRQLPQGDQIAAGKADVRDRAGDGNGRAAPVGVHAGHEDVLEHPRVESVKNLDAPSDGHHISDHLDELEHSDDNFAELAEPGPKAPETRLDKAIRELEAAIESGDDERISTAASATDKLEAEAAAAAARRDNAKRAIQDQIYARIEQGDNPQDAEAEVTGKSIDGIRRRDFMAQARADGHTGGSFDDLVGSVFDTMASEAYFAAEAATNGQMVRRQYEGKFGYRKFWYVNDATARKYASEELSQWFDENGRITKPTLREMILSGQSTYDRHREDFNQ